MAAEKPVKTGEFLIRIKNAKLQSSGDPYVVVKVGSERRETETKLKTSTPSWDEEFVIDLYKAEEKVRLVVMDKELIGSDDEKGRAEWVLGAPGGVSEFDGEVELMSAPGKKGKETKQDSYGTVTIQWSLCLSQAPSLFVLDEEVEDYDSVNPSSREAADEVARFLNLAYRFAAVGFKIHDHFMWVQPFASMGHLLLVFALYFYSSYGLDAMFPACAALFFYYARAQQRTLGINWTEKVFSGMEVEVFVGGTGGSTPFRRTMPEIKEMLATHRRKGTVDDAKVRKIMYIWARTFRLQLASLGTMIDGTCSDLTTGLYNSCLCLTGFTILVGSFVEFWRLGFLLVTLYMFMAFPLYTKYPRVRAKVSTEAVLKFWGHYTDLVKEKVMGKAASAMPEKPKVLEPIPAQQKTYSEWSDFYRNREKLREKYGVNTPPGSPGHNNSPSPRGAAPVKQPPPYRGVQVTVMQTRGVSHPDPLFMKVLADGQKFRTRPSSTYEWNISYEFPYVTGRALVELYSPSEADPKHPTLLAAGNVELKEGTCWVPLKTPTGADMGQVAMTFAFLKH